MGCGLVLGWYRYLATPLSPPSPLHPRAHSYQGYYYYTRQETGQQYGLHCRRRVPAAAAAPRETDVLDEAEPEEVRGRRGVEGVGGGVGVVAWGGGGGVVGDGVSSLPGFGLVWAGIYNAPFSSSMFHTNRSHEWLPPLHVLCIHPAVRGRLPLPPPLT